MEKLTILYIINAFIVLTNFLSTKFNLFNPAKNPAGSRPQAFKNPAPQFRPQANAQPYFLISNVIPFYKNWILG